MGFAVAAAHPGWGHTSRWCGEITSSARRVSRCRGLGARSAAVVKFSIKENSSNISFLTLDLSECLVLILAFSILKTVQGPITLCYRTEYNICKSKMKSRFELENHSNVIKTKETGHSDVVRTFFLWFLSKSASSKTSLILQGILVFGRAPCSGAAVLLWFLWRGS